MNYNDPMELMNRIHDGKPVGALATWLSHIEEWIAFLGQQIAEERDRAAAQPDSAHVTDSAKLGPFDVCSNDCPVCTPRRHMELFLRDAHNMRRWLELSIVQKAKVAAVNRGGGGKRAALARGAETAVRIENARKAVSSRTEGRDLAGKLVKQFERQGDPLHPTTVRKHLKKKASKP